MDFPAFNNEGTTPPFVDTPPVDVFTQEGVQQPIATPSPATVDVNDVMAPQSITETPTPLSAVTPTYTPEGSLSIIGAIPPASFDNFLKVLNVLVKDNKVNECITIRDSQIKQQAGVNLIIADLTSILNYKGQSITLDIINPKKYVNLFDQFRGQDNIYILDDNTNKRYLITNGEIELFLPKQENPAELSIESFDFTTAEPVSSRVIDKEARKIIKNLSKEQDHIEYLIHDGHIKAMHIPNTAKYVYQEFKNDPGAKQLNEVNSQLTLRTSGFLPIETDQYNLFIYKMPDNTYVTLVNCKIGGQINVSIIEQCNITTGGDLFV